MKNLNYLKSLIIISFILSSCSFVNENNIKESPPISVENFISSFQTGSKLFDDVQINFEDINTNDPYDEDNVFQQATEEDIKELIDILFDSNNQ